MRRHPALAATLMAVALALRLSVVAAQLTPTPVVGLSSYRGPNQQITYQGKFSDLAIAIDAYWADEFRGAGIVYSSPAIVPVDRLLMTACGPIAPEPNAGYCRGDRTIYLVPQYLVDEQNKFGDYAPVAILAHEWGHHIQTLLGVSGQTSHDRELQADCLLGAFTAYADAQGLLDYGDFIEAISAQLDAGDPLGFPEDAPGAHGTPEERVKALTKGYGGGPVVGCGIPLGSATSTQPLPAPPRSIQPAPQPVVGLPSLALLPGALPLPQMGCFHIAQSGQFTLDALARRLGSADGPERLQQWGWQDGAYLAFACNAPEPGQAGWIEVSVNRFADAASAQAALPYFVQSRASSTALRSVTAFPVGDRSAALAGPAYNGAEFTEYASTGPMLIRVTGIAPTGDPSADVGAVLRQVVAVANPGSAATPLPATAYLPGALPLVQAACFGVNAGTVFTRDSLAATFPDPAAAAGWLTQRGWIDGARLTFSCDHPPAGHAGWVQVSIHRFSTPEGAQQATSYFASGRVAGSELTEVPAPPLGDRSVEISGQVSNGTETTLYTAVGPLVIRVSAVSASGNPVADVEAIMQQIVSATS